MKTLLSILLLISTNGVWAQSSENFDLLTFSPLTGWKRNSSNADYLSYSTISKNQKAYCTITITRSTASKGSISADFESEWAQFVSHLNPTSKPEMTVVANNNGWDVQSGVASFTYDNTPAVARLITMSGFNRCTSIIILTNSKEYQSAIDTFVNSVNVKPLENTVSALPTGSNAPPAAIQPVGKNTIEPFNNLLGSWGRTQHNYMGSFISGYVKWQYTFNADGTYEFIKKIFSSSPVIYIEKESGNYQLSGNNLTLEPKRGVVEEWERINDFYKYGKFISQNIRPLEKGLYELRSHYFEGTNKWALGFQTNQSNNREGEQDKNGFYYYPVKGKSELIELPVDTPIKK
jgi:hypothetical protein